MFLLWAQPLYAGLALGVLMAAGLMRSQALNVSPRVSVAVGLALLAALGLLFAVGQTRISQASWVTYLLSACRGAPGQLRRAAAADARRPALPGADDLFLLPYLYPPRLLPGGALSTAPIDLRIPRMGAHRVRAPPLPLSYIFVRWIELPTLRIRGELLKAGSPVVRHAPWLAWGVSLVGVCGLIYFSRH